MGAHWQVFRLYSHFSRMGWLSNVNNVVDFGSCNTSCNGHMKYISEFIDAFKPERALPQDRLLQFDSAPIANLFSYLGCGYSCIDIDERPGTIQMDLNIETVPYEMLGQFDFVCDNGTIEHILNQKNCFKAAHDLCAPGGLMFFHKPFIGHYNHGFFNYMPDLFYQLSLANKYELKGMWYGIDYDPGFVDIDMKEQPDTKHSILFVAMKKTSANPFRLPYNFNGSDLMGHEKMKYV